MPDATITSTASTFGTITGTFAADQSTIVGTVTGIVAGTLDGSVGVPGPIGPTGPQGPEGPPGPPGEGGTWGSIVGTLSSQTDLWTELGTKYLASNPAGYQTAAQVTSALSPYLLASTASATYQTQAAMSAYLTTSAAAAGYYPLTGNPSGFLTAASLSGYATESWVDAQGYLQAGALTGYALESWVTSGFYPLASNPAGYLTAVPAGYATESWVTSQGYITSSALSPYLLSSTAATTYAPIAAGLPTGGDEGQIVVKQSSTDYDTAWADNSAETLTIRATNKTGSTLNKGAVVRIDGAQGQRPTIALAQANTGAGADGVIGVLLSTLANNATGLVCTAGLAKRLDTSAFTEGVKVFLSPTVAGGLTTTRPLAPDHSVAIGIISHSSATTGTIEVNVVVGTHLEWLHDVLLTSPANNDLLTYESSSDLWKNKSIGTLGLATQAWVDAQGYLQAGALTGYATESWVTSQGYLTDAPSDGNQYVRLNGSWSTLSVPADYITSVSSPLSVTAGDLSIDLTGYATESFVTSQGYITSSALSPYLLSADAASTYQTISGMNAYATKASPALTGNVTITTNSTSPALFIQQAGTGNILTLHDQASDTNFVAIDQNGKVSTIPAVTTGAGFNIAHGTTPTSGFVNGDVWTTTSGFFARINGSTRQYVDLDGTQTINGAKTFSGANQTLGNATSAGTINIGTGATVSGSTRTINIGTASAAGSTNAINIGGGSGTITTTFLGNIGGTFTRTGGKTNFAAPAAGYASVNFAPGNDPTTLATGDVWYDSLTNKLKLRAGFVDPIATESYISGLASNATPLVNGTASAGVSTNFSRNDHVHPTDTTRAPLASPALTGTPLSTTAAADTNTTQIATTAYVVGQAGSATPLVNGTAAVGTSLRYARQDHIHPTDTTRAALASPTFTGVPAAPTAAVDTNTTQLATTAYVVGQGYLKSATASSTYAPLASPALTGTPTAPTATAGTNTTQLATTAFVAAAVPAVATSSQARTFTNNTTAMSPRQVLWSMLSQDFIDIAGPSMTVTNTGTITYVQVGQLSRVIRPGNAGACSSRIRTFGTSQVDQTWTASSRPQPASFLNFSLRSIHSGRSTTSGVADANYTCAFYYGKAEADGVGDLIRRGYGWKMVGGAGSRFLQLQAHNGTTLSSVTSSFAVTAGVAFDWDIESDGAGNVTLYVNGSSVATSTGGPTGSVNITGVAWQEEMQAAAALSSPFLDFVNSRGRYIVINTW